MGVCEGEPLRRGMHWQQQPERPYVGPSPYDPSRDLSPNLPVDNSMGDVDPYHSRNSSSLCCNNNPCATTTPCNNPCPPAACNNNPCTPAACAFRHPSYPTPCSFPKQEPTQDLTRFENNNEVRCEVKQERSTPPSPPEVSECAGCCSKIVDRYYLAAVDRKWHVQCLQCCQCRICLDGEVTCFTRQGNIYCKKDYYRMFVMKRCARCQAAISSSELVMRARDLVFHVPCFSCSVCNVPLAKGDQFGLREGSLFCRAHLDLSDVSDMEPPSSYPHHYPTPFPSPEFHSHTPPIPLPPPGPSPPDVLASKVPFFNGAVAAAAPRQKGRPRKRKPKDLEGLTANLDLNDTTYLDYGRGPNTPGVGGSGRSKRMRTSFKHHQLRTMKSYFSINHNPDAKDLKQLSQKTSLPKRVLQVWFQNARAKWRRMMSKQEGKSDKSSESGGLSDLESYATHGGGSVSGGLPLGPHSPPFLLGGSSPPSLECS